MGFPGYGVRTAEAAESGWAVLPLVLAHWAVYPEAAMATYLMGQMPPSSMATASSSD